MMTSNGGGVVVNLTSHLAGLVDTASAMLSAHLADGERSDMALQFRSSFSSSSSSSSSSTTTTTTDTPSPSTDDLLPPTTSPILHHNLHHSALTLSLLSLLFFLIVLVGIVGNALVIFVVLTDRKMRQSVTNLLLLNLAVADVVMMVLGVPEIVQFLLDRGWVMGPVVCRLDRFVLVVCLYVSVLSLVSVCIERFVAIVFPIKAHVVCTRRKILYVIGVIWPLAILCGLPTVLFNRLVPAIPPNPNSDLHPNPNPEEPRPSSPPVVPTKHHCVIVFPGSHSRHYLTFKVTESLLFYFLPMVTQIALYSVVAKRLFASMDELQSRFQMRPPSADSGSIPLNGVPAFGGGGGGGGEEDGRESRNRMWNGHRGSSGTDRGSDRAVETIRARKGVVKMLVASVVVYIVSYSPHQAHLLYDIFSPPSQPFPQSWTFFVFVMVMTHLNSAANPVLYAIFSQNFRRNFKRCLCYLCCPGYRRQHLSNRHDSFIDSRGVSHRASTTLSRTMATRV